ncbi:histidine phosphatase family protein [Pseudovibrio ascidiaceicola]|uniref:histidine phosphatase family protein n=1 Tax=Pseudovibrio ascidiaceicola TaxID=285279 RepID=UPI003D361350
MARYPEIFVLRHGQTEWNVAGRFQGHQNSPLTEKGKQQALLQNKLLSGVEALPATAFVSPQLRTVHTAQLALGPQVEQKLDDRLKEINFGAWEGLTKQEVKNLVGDDFESGLWHFQSPQGETFEAISGRVQHFLEELTEPAVVVTHGITSIILRGLYMGLNTLELLQLPRKQGCIYHLSNGSEQVLE